MTTIPAETTWSEVELELLENEPFGFFPSNQDSYFGQIRKVIADYLQTQVVDMLTEWYNNLDPRVVNADDIGNWEKMLGIPAIVSKSLQDRRKSVTSRLVYGPFTRTARENIVKNYVQFTSLGAPTVLLPGGVNLQSGVTLFPVSGGAASYTITENVEAFSYHVEITGPLGFLPDLKSLSRDLHRITPAHISFSINAGDSPPAGGTFGSGTFGGGTYGGGA